jgi:hypothetical protein
VGGELPGPPAARRRVRLTYLNNHTREKYIPVDFKSKDYWQSRFKSMGWMAAASTHYELGPLGEAAFGNVGLEPGTKGAVDLVITPTLGLATLVVEDFADAKLIMPIERTFTTATSAWTVRSLLNPSRSMANLLSFKVPWHRTRARVWVSVRTPSRGTDGTDEEHLRLLRIERERFRGILRGRARTRREHRARGLPPRVRRRACGADGRVADAALATGAR